MAALKISGLVAAHWGSGEIIVERTVGKYMKEMGIKAQWIKPYTITTKDSDFSKKL